MAYSIAYSPEAAEHLRGLTARQRTTVMDAVDEQLAQQPGVETKNRKPMRPNPFAPWELRVGNMRVYYDIEEGDAPTVTVLAVGIKRRNRIFIGGEEVEL